MLPGFGLQYPERAGHARRVAALCSQVAERLAFSEQLSGALVRAAAAHDEGSTSSGSPNEVLQMWRGLAQGSPRQELRIAAQVLELCDNFDEAMEFSAFEEAAICESLCTFFNEHRNLSPDIADALRDVVLSKARLNLSKQLPVLPAAISQLLKTTESATAVELETIASSDPALAAQLLGTANSAYFGSRVEIRNIRQAIMRVGIPFARKILVSACVGPLFASSALKQLWSHSRLVAAVAHEIAGSSGFDSEMAYVAGLLHDIGRLPAQGAPQQLRAREAELIAAGFPLAYAETLLYGADHAAIGATLLNAWGLPGEIADAVAFHHRPEATESVLAGILCLAEDQCSGSLEALSAAYRRAVSCRLIGMPTANTGQPDFSAPIFAIAS